jgi:riboflavin synthase, alpha subunit
MFTGIVEELGHVERVEHAGASARLTVHAPRAMEGTRPGDSICVNGCCLTVAEPRDDAFTADLMAETLERTGLGELAVGSPVNLERALRPTDRMGGHIVQGHVDATAQILERRHEEHWDMLRVSVPEDLTRYVAVKGSIAIDGVSLTVVEVAGTVEAPGSTGSSGSLTVCLIPETLRRTTLGVKQPGDSVNLEVDVMAKYIERLLGTVAPQAQ